MLDKQLREKILELIPQKNPFRFVEDILSVDQNSITGVCHFPNDAFFYQGHFPQNPVTPGVILLEAMAQTGVVAQGIYLMLRENDDPKILKAQTMMFTMAQEVVFNDIVKPGERLTVKGEKIYYKKKQLKSYVKMIRDPDTVICRGVITGKGVMTHA